MHAGHVMISSREHAMLTTSQVQSKQPLLAQIPASAEQLEALKSLCAEATFGKGDKVSH